MGKTVDLEEHRKSWVTDWVVCLECCVPHLSVHHVTSADYGSEIECPECGEFACVETSYAIYDGDANGGVTWRNLALVKQEHQLELLDQLAAKDEEIKRVRRETAEKYRALDSVITKECARLLTHKLPLFDEDFPKRTPRKVSDAIVKHDNMLRDGVSNIVFHAKRIREHFKAELEE